MQKKINVIVDDTIKEDEVKAKAVLKDGTSIEYIVKHAKGSIENPMKLEDIVRKFQGLVENKISTSESDALIDRLLNVETIEYVRELTK